MLIYHQNRKKYYACGEYYLESTWQFNCSHDYFLKFSTMACNL